MYIILDNGSGELDREPVIHDDARAVTEAIERLVARTGIFYPGDVIKVVEQ